MAILLARPARTLLRKWVATELSIAPCRVVPFLRVATLHHWSILSSQSASSRPSHPSLRLTRRPYATRAGRPKAHTGRAAASKTPKAKSPTSKRSTPSKAAGAKPTAKKAKAKPNAGAGKKSGRPLSEAGKKRAERRKELAKIKELKATALSPPKRLPDTAWTVYVSEQMKDAKTKIDKSLGEQFRDFTPEQKEHYNHLANQNKSSNVAAYKTWIESYTPGQINLANNARRYLKKQSKTGAYSALKDDRHVKQPKSAYIFYTLERVGSGDFKHMKVSEIGALVGSEWKGLTQSEKQKYKDAQAADKLRYIQEYKTVHGKDPVFVTKGSKAKSS